MRLKELRIEKGLSQKALADELGYKQNTISQWETGNRFMDTETLKMFASFFDVSISYLMGETNSDNKSEDLFKAKLLSEYNKLNDIGKREAIKRISELSHLPMYCNKQREMPIAAHNDAVIDDKELKLMQEDIDEL